MGSNKFNGMPKSFGKFPEAFATAGGVATSIEWLWHKWNGNPHELYVEQKLTDLQGKSDRILGKLNIMEREKNIMEREKKQRFGLLEEEMKERLRLMAQRSKVEAEEKQRKKREIRLKIRKESMGNRGDCCVFIEVEF